MTPCTATVLVGRMVAGLGDQWQFACALPAGHVGPHREWVLLSQGRIELTATWGNEG